MGRKNNIVITPCYILFNVLPHTNILSITKRNNLANLENNIHLHIPHVCISQFLATKLNDLEK